MQIKYKHREFDNWRTCKQWNEEDYQLNDNAKGVCLYVDRWCKISAYYYSPDEVHEMNDEEIKEYKESKKAYAREQARKRREKKRAEEKEIEEWEQEKKKALKDNRTVYSWLQELRRVVDLWDFNYSERLNSDYNEDMFEKGLYYNYENTEEIKINENENIDDIKEKEIIRFSNFEIEKEVKRINENKNIPENIKELKENQERYFSPLYYLENNKMVVALDDITEGKFLNMNLNDEGPFIPNNFYVIKWWTENFKDEEIKEKYSKALLKLGTITEDNLKDFIKLIKRFNPDE